MDFIMPDYKKFSVPVLRICLAFMLPVVPPFIYAEPANHFTIEHAELKRSAGEYLLDADIKLRLSEEVIAALEHGISLQIDTEIRIKQTRTWLWDKIIGDKTLSWRLKYHPLSNQYIVAPARPGIKQHFQTLKQALKFIGTIKEQRAFTAGVLERNNNYTAQIRARLNIKSLPTPLRLTTYIDTNWQLASPWFIWKI